MWQVIKRRLFQQNKGNTITVIHVLPTYDSEHRFEDLECACTPDVEWFETGNAVIVHRDLN